MIEAVTDKEIVSAYKLLAQKEGVFVEPASAASVAGLLKLKRRGYFQKRNIKGKINIVCTLTGHGLKDPQIAIKSVKTPRPLAADIKKIAKVAGLKEA